MSDDEPIEFEDDSYFTADMGILWAKMDDALFDGDGDGEPVGVVQPTACEQHMPWFCSECAVSRCSAWTPQGGGRCCWCGVWLAMP